MVSSRCLAPLRWPNCKPASIYPYVEHARISNVARCRLPSMMRNSRAFNIRPPGRVTKSNAFTNSVTLIERFIDGAPGSKRQCHGSNIKCTSQTCVFGDSRHALHGQYARCRPQHPHTCRSQGLRSALRSRFSILQREKHCRCHRKI